MWLDYTGNGSRKSVVPQQITYGSIFRVLVVGFSIVIILLIAAGAVGLNNAHSFQASASGLVAEQSTTTRLVEEVEREQDALNAVFYKLSRGPELVDRDRVLQQLDEADRSLDRIVAEARGRPQEGLWMELLRSSKEFSGEARRLLALPAVPSYLSRDLFRRHEEVTSVIARLIGNGYQRMLTARSGIELRSNRLARDSLILLIGSLLAALICAALTVRITAALFKKMEWQTGELSRVSWRMVENQETTARRFSHELHDELGQALTAIKANLLSLESSQDTDRTRIEDCRRVVDDAIRNVRELSQLLRPTILDDFGLDASIRWLAERFMQRTGIEVEYRSEFSARLPDEAETHLFRIVQEALTNVARHSAATRVAIHLRTQGERICLTLTDNGKGVPADNGNLFSGMGIVGCARGPAAPGEK